MKVSAIIVAAGKGERMGSGEPKQFLEMMGRPIICHTLDRFAQFKDWDIAIGVAPDRVDKFKSEIIEKFDYPKRWRIVAGGIKRQDTVRNCLLSITSDADIIIVHDGVRPFITEKFLEESVNKAFSSGACIAAAKVVPTIKEVNADNTISRTIDRQNLWEAQTPQTFRREILTEAMERAYHEGYYGTDEASLVERIGKNVSIIESATTNIKITTPADLAIGDAISASFIYENRNRIRHS